MRLILVRHGETTWNKEGRYIGRTDLELSETGIQQAKSVAKYLASEKITNIYTSDLKRAIQTAEEISGGSGQKLKIDDRLKEVSFGVFEGLTFAEVDQKYPDSLAAWLADYDKPPSGGESLSSLSERVADFLELIRVNKDGEKCAVIVSHGGPLREIVRQVLRMPPHTHWFFTFSPGSISEILLYSPGPVVSYLNVIP